MGNALKATDYLASPEKHPAQAVCVVFGSETFLKRHALARLRDFVLGPGEGDFSSATFDGTEVELRDVLDELSTVAMFGAGQRLVVVEDAADFVTRFRAQLEEYVDRPRRTGVLVLETRTWPGNTRLAKAVARSGLAIDCTPLDGRQVVRWIRTWARQAHGVEIAPAAADQLVELAGSELGLIDQELAKLALAVPAGEKVQPEQVAALCGSWRSKTTWDMLDATLDGNLQDALVQLDRLLLAGESPVGILAQVSASLRRLAAATCLVLAAEAAGRGLAVREALAQAGVKPFAIHKSERHLRRLGRERGARLFRWLLQADLDLKGESAMPARLILERLIIRLGSPPPERAPVRAHAGR